VGEVTTTVPEEFKILDTVSPGVSNSGAGIDSVLWRLKNAGVFERKYIFLEVNTLHNFSLLSEKLKGFLH
jgi:hypothetical protein